MITDRHPCRLDFKNCTYTLADGPKEDCAECNPQTPPSPVTSSSRPGDGVQATPRATDPPPARGVSDGDAAVRGGEAATAASLDKQRQRWSAWELYDWPLSDPHEYARILNQRHDYQAAVRVERGAPVVYVRWAF